MSNNKQQTAVEWLEQINNHCKKYGRTIEQKDIEKAKEMEKEQTLKFGIQCQLDFIANVRTVDEIYNETYGGNK